MTVNKRIEEIERNLSGFKNAKDRLDAIRYLKSLDPDIDPADIVTFEDYQNEIKTFFAPLPNTPEYEKWIGTEMHAKYLRRQEKRQVQV